MSLAKLDKNQSGFIEAAFARLLLKNGEVILT